MQDNGDTLYVATTDLTEGLLMRDIELKTTGWTAEVGLDPPPTIDVYKNSGRNRTDRQEMARRLLY